MDYVPPLGTDPSDPDWPLVLHVNRNPALGLVGSFPSADGFNALLLEMRNAIVGAGLTPSTSNLEQLLEAITLLARMAAGRLITTDTVLTVDPAVAVSATNFHTIQAAIDSLDTALIAPRATVRIEVSGVVHTITETIIVDHVHAGRINLVGAALPGAFPVEADLVATLATARSNLRAKVPTVLSLQGVTGIETRRGGLGLIQDIMFDHNGAGTIAQGCILALEGTVNLSRVVAFGCNLAGVADGAGLAAEGRGQIYADTFLIGHCDAAARALNRSYIRLTGPSSPKAPIGYCDVGAEASSGGQVSVRSCKIFQCAEYGIFANVSGVIFVDSAVSEFASNFQNAGALGGRVNFQNASLLGAVSSSFSLVANEGGYINAFGLAGGSVVSCTPAADTVGNRNSYIRIT